VIKRTESQFIAVTTVKIAEVTVGTREVIVGKLKENGCRITKQRLVLIDIILENECQSCKEIYYKAVEIDDKIGVATVYRMVNALEEVGAINRKLVLTL
jgi:Fur family ferric uptake transcriptional regulator